MCTLPPVEAFGIEGPEPQALPAALQPCSQAAPEGDEAGGEQREGQHAQDHTPEPIVHGELAPPHFGQKGLKTEGASFRMGGTLTPP